MKKIVILACAVILMTSNIVFAESLADESMAKELTEKIMIQVGTGNYTEAFNQIKEHSFVKTKDLEDVARKLNEDIRKYGEHYGKTEGYEFIDSKKVGNSLLRFRYLEKSERDVRFWCFNYIKTKSGWIIDSFEWSGSYTTLFLFN